jgi:hypothetical protein
MQLTILERIEDATACRWWLLALLLLASTPWPVLVLIELGAIWLAVYHATPIEGAA